MHDSSCSFQERKWDNIKYEHTGIYIKHIDDEHFESIEGNTSMKNNSNGGCVMRRERKYSQAIFASPSILNE